MSSEFEAFEASAQMVFYLRKRKWDESRFGLRGEKKKEVANADGDAAGRLAERSNCGRITDERGDASRSSVMKKPPPDGKERQHPDLRGGENARTSGRRAFAVATRILIRKRGSGKSARERGSDPSGTLPSRKKGRRADGAPAGKSRRACIKKKKSRDINGKICGRGNETAVQSDRNKSTAATEGTPRVRKKCAAIFGAKKNSQERRTCGCFGRGGSGGCTRRRERPLSLDVQGVEVKARTQGRSGKKTRSSPF